MHQGAMASIPPQSFVWTRLGLASLLTRDPGLLCLTPDKDGAEEAITTRLRQRGQAVQRVSNACLH